MGADQPVELLVPHRRGQMYVIAATYIADLTRDGESSPRRLTPSERHQVGLASRLLSDAMIGLPVDEVEAGEATELLHRLSMETEGEPHFRLEDGRIISGAHVNFRPRM